MAVISAGVASAAIAGATVVSVGAPVLARRNEAHPLRAGQPLEARAVRVAQRFTVRRIERWWRRLGPQQCACHKAHERCRALRVERERHVAHRREQQHQRRRALLAIDDDRVGRLEAAALHDHAAEPVRREARRSGHVAPQPLLLRRAPAVPPLEERHEEPWCAAQPQAPRSMRARLGRGDAALGAEPLLRELLDELHVGARCAATSQREVVAEAVGRGPRGRHDGHRVERQTRVRRCAEPELIAAAVGGNPSRSVLRGVHATWRRRARPRLRRQRHQRRGN